MQRKLFLLFLTSLATLEPFWALDFLAFSLQILATRLPCPISHTCPLLRLNSSESSLCSFPGYFRCLSVLFLMEMTYDCAFSILPLGNSVHLWTSFLMSFSVWDLTEYFLTFIEIRFLKFRSGHNSAFFFLNVINPRSVWSVSYTHLTLPTKA